MSEQKQMTTVQTVTPEALAMLGAPSLAYIRPVKVSGAEGWGIFAANGQPMGMVESREEAFAAARQHDLSPVSVH